MQSDLPSFVIYAAHGEVLWGKPTTFYVNLTIPAGQSDSYYMEVLLPEADDAPVMTFCDYEFQVYYVGHNFPCLADPTVTLETSSGVRFTSIGSRVRVVFDVLSVIHKYLH